MFGYINPERPHLFIKDEILYKSLYCGMCKSIGKSCGTFSKTALTYDMAFMSALLHNIKNVDVKIEKHHCALHPFKRRAMAMPDETSLILGCVNTALAYFKLIDDKRDGEGKGMLSFLYKKGYKKTAKKHPKVIEIISSQMEEQRKLEENGSDIIDMACEPTANMMKELSKYVLGDYSSEDAEWLCYDIGKWVYLADALDDYDKDVKKGRYNVLYNAYKQSTKEQAVKANEGELNFIFNSLFADMRMHLAKIKFYFNHDLTDNIILLGIPTKTRQLVYGKCGDGKKEVKDEQTKS
jgi:hypothetical protein